MFFRYAGAHLRLNPAYSQEECWNPLIESKELKMKNQEISNKQLITFGIALSIFLLIFGSLNFFFGNQLMYLYLWVAAGLICLISILTPKLVKPIYKGALFVAHILGWINTRLFLGLIFYSLFTLIAIIFKIIRKDLLDRKIDRDLKSYWNFREKKTTAKETYLRQF